MSEKFNKTKIELSPEDARLFRKFRKHQDVWQEVFKIRGGKALLHFDEKGKLRKAVVDKTVFKL